MRKLALVIGARAYHDQRFPELPGAAEDAQQLTTVLSDKIISEFSVDTLVDETAGTVMRRMEMFFREADHDDFLLMHLSCHGQKDAWGRLHFIAADTEPDYLASSAIPAAFVADQMDLSLSKRIVLMLDCCYSGAFVRGMRPRADQAHVDVAEPLSGPGRVVMTSSNALQYSYENQDRSRRPAEPALFTAAVVSGLRDGSADLNGDGFVDVSELYTFVHQQVASREPSQTPMQSNSIEGSLYLTRNPRLMGAMPIPGLAADVWGAIASQKAWMRHGALFEVERLLDAPSAAARQAARDALALLTRDINPAVADRAAHLWNARGLDLIAATGASSPAGPARPEAPERRRGRYVGIDFGTTNSAISVLLDGEPAIITDATGAAATPSCVAFSANGDLLVGEAATRQEAANQDRTFGSIKRRMGTDWTATVDGQVFTAREIAAFILRKLKADAETSPGADVTGAVIAVPAYFGDAQRQAIREAGQIAGLNVLRLISEPAAAMLAHPLDDEATVLLVDMGGGSLSVALIDAADGVVDVRAVSGALIRGEDWDEQIVGWLVAGFKHTYRIDLARNGEALSRLREAAERAKYELCDAPECRIGVPGIARSRRGPLHLEATLTRTAFERMTADLLGQVRACVQQVLTYAGVAAGDIDRVLLAGAGTRMPAVANLVTTLAKGQNGDGQPKVSILRADAVAAGAAVQAGILSGEVRNVLPLDVAPLSLGIETKGGLFTTIIGRNTTIPTKRSEIFTTADDDQDSITIELFQGRGELTRGGDRLGTFVLAGIPPALRGTGQFEITFDIGLDGIASVSAKNAATGDRQPLAFSNVIALPAADIKRMTAASEKYFGEHYPISRPAGR